MISLLKILRELGVKGQDLIDWPSQHINPNTKINPKKNTKIQMSEPTSDKTVLDPKVLDISENDAIGYDTNPADGKPKKNREIHMSQSTKDISMLEPKILNIAGEPRSYDPINNGEYDELNYHSPIFLNPNV